MHSTWTARRCASAVRPPRRSRGAGAACVAWGLLAAGSGLATAVVAAEDRAASSAISYAFATELGSGVYDLGGRSMQVYRIEPGRTLRRASDAAPGIRFTVPVTGGFFDFTPVDAIGGNLPSRIDSLSVMPGVVLDWPLADDWHLRPHVGVGASFVQGNADAWLASAGLRLERRREQGALTFTRRHELAVAAVHYRTAQPDDQFVRVRQAVTVERISGRAGRARRPMLGAYAMLDVVPDPPDVPLSAGNQGLVQFELGFTLDAAPALRLGGVALPGIGLGYRVAGDFSGWRLVIGAPF